MGAKSRGYYQGSSVAAAKTLAEIAATTVPTDSDYCIVQAQDQNCRWRSDGTAPTASVGSLLASGDSIIVRRAQYTNFKIIETAASAKVNVEFFKTG